MAEFQPGSVVQLRSGGARMTLVRYQGPPGPDDRRPEWQSPPDEGWGCTWHCQSTPRWHTYPEAVLRLADDEPEPEAKPAKLRAVRAAMGT
jgi:uncharacterized protein YodC (DUF2158 family)